MRLIDADELLARYKARCNGCKDTKNYCEHCCDIADIINDIEDAPTIEERKKGKWREIQRYSPTDKAATNECSLCHDTVWMYDGERRWNYCPSCGAEMEYKNEKVK